MSDARHHHAHAPAVIIVPVPILAPFEGGSPESIRQTKPPRYPSERREAWRPARAIPGRKGKAERIARWLDGWAKQDRDVREFMDSCRTA